MSLAFLAKKSWHTTNIKNVENVWLREAKKEAESKKLEELRRQIEEERQIEELEQLQEESGLVKRDFKKKAKLAWMYQGPAANAVSNEEYLSGKKSAKLEEGEDDVKALENPQKPGSLWLAKVTNDQNEQFTRLNEDPLFHIKKRQQQDLRKITSNPVKMQQARERAIRELERKVKSQKHERKKKKKSKSEKKGKKDKKKHKHKHKDGEKYKEKYDSGSDSYSHRHSRKERKRGRDEFESGRSRRNEYESSRRYRRHDREGDRSRHQRRRRSASLDAVDVKPDVKDEKAPKLYLGPSQEILQKRAAYVAEKNKKMELLRANRGLSSSAQKLKLEQMASEGQSHEEQRYRLTEIRKKAEAVEEAKEASRRADELKQQGAAPSFISSAKNDIANKSLEDQIKSKRHFQQRNPDGGNFLSR